MLLVLQSPVLLVSTSLSSPACNRRRQEQEQCNAEIIQNTLAMPPNASVIQSERENICCDAGWRLLGRVGADSLGQPSGLWSAVRNHSALPLSAHRLRPDAAAALADRSRPAGLRILPQRPLCQGKSGRHGERHAICCSHGPRVRITPVSLSCLCVSCVPCPI